MDDGRTDVPRTGGERELLRAYLDFHRETLAVRCAGLSDDDLRRRPTVSVLSLLGLVRHMAEVERSWFRRVVDGQDVPLVWSPEGDVQAAFDAAGAAPEEAFAAWQAEIAIARDIQAAVPSLDATGVDRRSGEAYSLRRVMVHLIQEYARHNGHADLIREAIDGATGSEDSWGSCRVAHDLPARHARSAGRVTAITRSMRLRPPPAAS